MVVLLTCGGGSGLLLAKVLPMMRRRDTNARVARMKVGKKGTSIIGGSAKNGIQDGQFIQCAILKRRRRETAVLNGATSLDSAHGGGPGPPGAGGALLGDYVNLGATLSRHWLYRGE